MYNVTYIYSNEDKPYDLWESIIMKIAKRPILWNYTLPLKVRIKEAATAAWNEVAEVLQISNKDAQSKWRYLREK